MNRVQIFQQKQRSYQKDPVLFFRELLKFEPDDWQKEVAMDLAEYPRVSVRSGQGVGKTGLEAALLLWFLCCFPFPRVVATAPTRQQLHDVLWAEVAKWQAQSPILSVLLKWTKTYIYMVGMEKRWFAVARTATKAENMQGFHEDHMLFIVDEASGIRDEIMEAILGTLSGENNKLLLCGNPTRISGIFHASHTKMRGQFRTHRVSARMSPRTNKDNIKALEENYGVGSNVVRVRVEGEFPISEDDVFVPLPLLERSIHTQARQGEIESIHIGCDVARYGDDKTVIGYKINEQVQFHKKAHGQDTMRTASDIVLLGEWLKDQYQFTGTIAIKVDDGGVGGGVVDRLRQMKRNYPSQYDWMMVFPVMFGQPIKHKYFHDSTTYMMSVLKSLLSTHDQDGTKKEVELVLPNDNDLIAQLSSRKYTLNDRNKIVVESKKAMKSRGLPSPDEADCVLLCCLPVKMKQRRKQSSPEGSEKG